MRLGKPITSHKLDKSGKLVAKKPKRSVSQQIAARKKPFVRVQRRSV